MLINKICMSNYQNIKDLISVSKNCCYQEQLAFKLTKIINLYQSLQPDEKKHVMILSFC